MCTESAEQLLESGCVLTIKSPRCGSLEDDPYEISVDYPAALPRIHDARDAFIAQPLSLSLSTRSALATTSRTLI